MKIEHITLHGNSIIRDSEIIEPTTIALLTPFQIREGSKTLAFPRTNFSVKITASEEGAIFDILRLGKIAICNVCCFDASESQVMFNHVRNLVATMGVEAPAPIQPCWIYSIPIDFTALSPEEIVIAGEVELYIYYSLYLARL